MRQMSFNPVQYGWVCPLCGYAHSPHTVTCFCKSADVKTTDTGTRPYPGVTVRTDTEVYK